MPKKDKPDKDKPDDKPDKGKPEDKVKPEDKNKPKSCSCTNLYKEAEALQKEAEVLNKEMLEWEEKMCKIIGEIEAKGDDISDKEVDQYATKLTALIGEGEVKEKNIDDFQNRLFNFLQRNLLNSLSTTSIPPFHAKKKKR